MYLLDKTSEPYSVLIVPFVQDEAFVVKTRLFILTIGAVNTTLDNPDRVIFVPLTLLTLEIGAFCIFKLLSIVVPLAVRLDKYAKLVESEFVEIFLAVREEI